MDSIAGEQMTNAVSKTNETRIVARPVMVKQESIIALAGGISSDLRQIQILRACRSQEVDTVKGP